MNTIVGKFCYYLALVKPSLLLKENILINIVNTCQKTSKGLIKNPSIKEIRVHQVAKRSYIKTCHVSHLTLLNAMSVINNKIINIEQKSVNKGNKWLKETLLLHLYML